MDFRLLIIPLLLLLLVNSIKPTKTAKSQETKQGIYPAVNSIKPTKTAKSQKTKQGNNPAGSNSENFTCIQQPSLINKTLCEGQNGWLTEDGINCSCFEGYIGPDCADDVNECITNKRCGSHTCNNTMGGYFCTCNKGYYTEQNKALFCPNEPACIDINECEEDRLICGPYGNCSNIDGDYTCKCLGNSRKIINNTKDPCVVKCKTTSKDALSETQPPCTNSLCHLNNLISSVTPSCNETTVDQQSAMEKLLNELESLLADPVEDKLEFAKEMLYLVEDISRVLTLLHQTNITLQSKEKSIALYSLRTSIPPERISLKSNASFLHLHGKDAANRILKDLIVFGFLEYRNISHLLQNASFLDASSKVHRRLISPVISTFVGSTNTTDLKEPFNFRLQHETIEKHNWTVCVFWVHDKKSWSSTGCEKINSTENETFCRCSHMTSFAILMAMHDIEESWELTLITKICLSISIICLVLSVLTFGLCRSIRGIRNTIHLQLCASLLFGNIIFLWGIQATWHEVLCSVIAGFLHFFYLSAFCCMALEGLELYLMLVTVFNTHILKKRHLLAVGYGIPAVIVTISAITYSKGYGTPKHCWLSLENGFIWSFIGPVCFILLINCGIFVLTVWKLTEKMSSISPEMGKYKMIRTLTITAVAQLSILGCTWVFGFLQFGAAALVFANLFAILNSLQGLQIFVLHCLINRQVRDEYALLCCAIVHLKTPSRYTEFTSNSASATNTLTKVKSPNKESNL
ncbi:adhesion G protein-coupled receptor E5 isoform X2 [Bombina bombina]|uniref:adhesion G protein-coupled receptor E5 isoform X2 n=1 Tax=Bombina bombina TaxID=8345 RepID=UPI00235AF944|nr:adhesion G protein-coupled receptor E5 isoform X2 [Bombina bombina]